ncbi:MAG: gamma-glutamylcyclotransferase [Alphaproteobacteria bacterium]|nr:gamma-glutamylcyclotransferase [Alphaproteobacteria bacterium]
MTPPIVLRASPFRPDFELPAGDLWVFGYGSLMWDPGFPHRGAMAATLYGYHRAFCIWSHHYRGTRERPGLVLGLDAGGACRGRVFRVDTSDREAVIKYLFDREMISGVYRPKLHRVLPDGAAPVLALTFVANRRHEQYAGKMPEREVARHIAAACGVRGPNRDYLANTCCHLDELGLADGPLHRILKLLEEMC